MIFAISHNNIYSDYLNMFTKKLTRFFCIILVKISATYIFSGVSKVIQGMHDEMFII